MMIKARAKATRPTRCGVMEACFFARYLIGTLVCADVGVVVIVCPCSRLRCRDQCRDKVAFWHTNYRYTRHYKWRYDNSIFMLAAAPLPFFDTRYLIFQIARSSYRVVLCATAVFTVLSASGASPGAARIHSFRRPLGARPPHPQMPQRPLCARVAASSCGASPGQPSRATTLSLRHRNQHYRTTTCPHTGCHVSTIYFPHPPIAPLNLIPQKPQRISPLIARR